MPTPYKATNSINDPPFRMRSIREKFFGSLSYKKGTVPCGPSPNKQHGISVRTFYFHKCTSTEAC